MNRVLTLLFVVLISFSACSVNADEKTDGAVESKKMETLSFACWNVQTFFDGETDGNEYEEFQSAGKWSRDKYLVRLQRLCDVMQELNADVYVFEEIENDAVIYDISNHLTGGSWSAKSKWHYACFAKNEGSSIGCAVISKYPLSGVKTHDFDVRTMKVEQPAVRPLVEVRVEVGERELVVFAAHWKSKIGDEESTEMWRDWQEALLALNLAESRDESIVICGDFNRDAKDFVLAFDGNDRSSNTILRAANGDGGCTVKVFNPWFNSDGEFSTETGSYYYDESWERIDQILTYGNVKLSSFAARAEEPWANEKGIPVGYKIYTGEGYSDHLPVMCTLVLGNKE